MPEALKVLIVDDSRLFRGTVAEIVSSVPGLTVAGSVFNGVKCVEFVRQFPVDLVLLDQEMPEMDGLSALSAIQKFNQENHARVAVLMVSSYTKVGAETTVKALTLGAFDFVSKPQASDGVGSEARFRTDLIGKLKTFMLSRQPVVAVPMSTAAAVVTPTDRSRRVRAIVIGSSTGGPKALGEVMPGLSEFFPQVPIFIVQHMPVGFTASLAQTLAKQTNRPCVEAKENDPVDPRTIYIAPGGKHLNLRRGGLGIHTGLPDLPPENGCKPAADVLFRSSADCYGNELLAIILTGMGNDGTAGLGHVKRAGGHVIAQDQATSVVWGMPGSAVAAGVVDEVHPLSNIAVAADLYQRRLAMKTKA
jgi:two-component system, chemotaxis family, protein-glutamate methylesterase/glutaminase